MKLFVQGKEESAPAQMEEQSYTVLQKVMINWTEARNGLRLTLMTMALPLVEIANFLEEILSLEHQRNVSVIQPPLIDHSCSTHQVTTLNFSLKRQSMAQSKKLMASSLLTKVSSATTVKN